MALLYDTMFEVRTSTGPDVWTEIPYKSYDYTEALAWSDPAQLTVEFDNQEGANRAYAALGRLCRLTRNTVEIFRGTIIDPEYTTGDSHDLKLTAKDYYAQLLIDKLTGPNYMWTFKDMDPRDLVKCAVGTMYVLQETFEGSEERIDTKTNTCIAEQSLQLVKNGDTYQPTGSMTSKYIQNSFWNTMGVINSVDIQLLGTSATSSNIITNNPGYESDFTNWSTYTPNGSFDTSHTDTTTANFDENTTAVSINGGFETDVTGWTVAGTGAAVAQSAVWYNTGTKSMKITVGSGGTASIHNTTAFTSTIGDLVKCTFVAMSPTAGTLTVYLQDGSDGTQFSSQNFTLVANTPLYVDYTGRNSHYTGNNYVYVSRTTANGTYWYMDDVTIGVNRRSINSAGDQLALDAAGTDFSDTETSEADFNAGSNSNTDVVPGGTGTSGMVTLNDQNSVSYESYTDTTTADFNGGSYSNTTGTVTADQVKLTIPGSSFSQTENTSGTLGTGTLTDVSAASGALKQTILYGPDACGSTTGWTVAGSYFGVLSGYGNGGGDAIGSSRATTGGTSSGYGKRSDSAPAANSILQFDFYLANQDTGAGDLYLMFMCDTNGSGQGVKFSGGDGNGGICSTTTWTSSGTASGGSNVSQNTWHTAKLVIGATTAQVYVDGSAFGDSYTFSNNGTYWGIWPKKGYCRVDNIVSYKTNGQRNEPSISLTSVGVCGGSSISWTVGSQPSGTNVYVDASWDNSNWYACTSGNALPQLNTGDSMSGKTLYLRERFTTSVCDTATITYINISVTAGYNTSGTWTSPSTDSFTIVGIQSSEISWNTGGTGTITVESRYSTNGGSSWSSYASCTNGQAIPGITSNMGATLIQTRVNFSGNATTTPTLLDIVKTVNYTKNYVASGNWSQIYYVGQAGVVAGSSISWNANVVGSTTITVKTAYSTNFTYNWSTEQTCTSGQAIPDLTAGMAAYGLAIKVIVYFTSSDPLVSASLYDISIGVTAGKAAAGLRRLAGISLNTVGPAEAGYITPNGTMPANTTLSVRTSLDAGATWSDPYTPNVANPITGVANQDMTGKTLYVRVDMLSSDGTSTPTLTDVAISVTSKKTETVAINTNMANVNGGTKSAHFKCLQHIAGNWTGMYTDEYASTASTLHFVTAYVKGTVTSGHVYIMIDAFNASHAYISRGGITLTAPFTAAEFALQSGSWTTPVGTAYVKAMIYADEASANYDLYIDDAYIGKATNELSVDVSRDDGANYFNVAMSMSGAGWSGSYTFTDNPAVKNKLKYKVNLIAQNSNTSTSKVTRVTIKCNTVSDTGVGTGTLDTYENSNWEDDYVDMDFGNITRYEMISRIVAATGMDAYVSGGNVNLVTHRGSSIAKTMDTTTNLISLTRKIDRSALCNRVTLIGSGQIDKNMSLTGTCNVQDADSVALYGAVERVFNIKNVNDLAVLNGMAYLKLERLKQPEETSTGTMKDDATTAWSMGDEVTVNDPTGSTGYSNASLRIVKATRSHSTDGEIVDLEFSNVLKSVKDAMQSIGDYINQYTGYEQQTLSPAYVNFHDDCDNGHPAKLMVYIDPNKELKDVLLSVYTEKFRATASSVNAASGGGTTSGGGTSHNHSVSWGNHSHTVDISGHNHNMNYSTISSGETSGHTHTYQYVNNTSQVNGTTSPSSSDGGGNSLTSGSDTSHTHSVPDHTHTATLVYGIYEFGYAARVQCFLNDSACTTANTTFGTRGTATANGEFQIVNMSLIANYSTSSSTGILGPGINFIRLKPLTDANNTAGLIRICAFVTPVYK